MAGKALNTADVHRMWGFYLEKQTAKHVRERCAEEGISVHANTISKYINRGDPKRKTLPFKQRYAELKEVIALEAEERAVQSVKVDPSILAAPPIPSAQVASAAPVNQPVAATIDQAIVSIAADALEFWRIDLSRWLGRLARAGDEVDTRIEMLADGNASNPDKELMTIMKTISMAAKSHKDLVSTADLLRVMDGPKADGRDAWLQEHFEDWSPEEHAAFRDHAIWPARMGPRPDWLELPDGEPEEEPEGEPESDVGELDEAAG